MGWGSNGSTMQSLLQGKQEIQSYLKKEVWLLYRAGHCTWSGLKKGIKVQRIHVYYWHGCFVIKFNVSTWFKLAWGLS